jgi:hypothetical protein
MSFFLDYIAGKALDKVVSSEWFKEASEGAHWKSVRMRNAWPWGDKAKYDEAARKYCEYMGYNYPDKK